MAIRAYNTCPIDKTPLFDNNARLKHINEHNNNKISIYDGFKLSDDQRKQLNLLEHSKSPHTNPNNIRPSAKSNVKMVTIDNIEFAQKTLQNTGFLTNSVDAKVHMLNEAVGYTMVKDIVGENTKNKVKISEKMYVDEQKNRTYTTKSGQEDLMGWLRVILDMNKTKTLTPVQYISIDTSVRVIMQQLHLFIETINCHGSPSTYHCDLHPENIRLNYAGGDALNVHEVYVIDFDMVRAGRCDKFRSSSKVFGLQKAIGDKVKNIISLRTSDPTCTDWAFLNSLRRLIYDTLLSVVGKPKDTKGINRDILGKMDEFTISKAESTLLNKMIDGTNDMIEWDRSSVYTYLRNRSKKESTIDHVKSACPSTENTGKTQK